MTMIDDDKLRWHLYDLTMSEGRPPRIGRMVEVTGHPADAIQDALQRLARRRMVVLDSSGEVLMAGPFSAVPTPFAVTLRRYTAFANCVWDALGIPATMREDARIDTSCADCGVTATLHVRGGHLEGSGFMHFPLRPRHWWDDIVFT